MASELHGTTLSKRNDNSQLKYYFWIQGGLLFFVWCFIVTYSREKNNYPSLYLVVSHSNRASKMFFGLLMDTYCSGLPVTCDLWIRARFLNHAKSQGCCRHYRLFQIQMTIIVFRFFKKKIFFANGKSFFIYCVSKH